MGCGESKPAPTTRQKSTRKYAQDTNARPRPQSRSRSSRMPDAAPTALPTSAPVPLTDVRQQESARKIQHLIRRKSSREVQRQEQEWKIFNDIDLQDEAQMLMLANFMQTLLDTNYSSGALSAMADTPGSIKSDSSPSTPPPARLLSMDTINLDFGGGNNKRISARNGLDFDMPKGPIAKDTVKDVIALYKIKGKLSGASVQNIMRQAYKLLKQESNIKRMTVASGERLAIIGDLHGQIKDLLFILDENGLPSVTNKYIFNGDFVDRGTSGVEVLSLLLCLYCAYPGCVSLNRGNHEDYAVCCVYGFQTECTAKYDETFFGMFCELFNYLPVCSMVNDSILVIHGGLFHDPDVTLADLEAISRSTYKVAVGPEEELDTMMPAQSEEERLERVFVDAMWSDPHAENTLLPNPRGSGVLFGPDHTRRFLDRNNLSMIIRSHECVRGGVAFPFHGADKKLICTVFSASNYGGSGNKAAYMAITTHVMSDSKPVRNSDLNYSVQSFTTALIEEVSLEQKNRVSVMELLFRRRRGLKLSFESKDVTQSGLVSFSDWAREMAEVTGLKILWIPLIHTIVPEDCIEGAFIKYQPFLDSISEEQSSFHSDEDVGSLYGPVEQLDLIFKAFDADGDGKISRAEFKMGCDHLNSTLPEEHQFKDIDQLLKLLDQDGDDCIDKNELFEMFRHLDAKDGVVDGIISVASKFSVQDGQ